MSSWTSVAATAGAGAAAITVAELVLKLAIIVGY
jgi:hypothetical protein